MAFGNAAKVGELRAFENREGHQVDSRYLVRVRHQLTRIAGPEHDRRDDESGAGRVVVEESEHQHAGRLRQARNAARFEGTPTELRYGAPHLGEHSAALLEEVGVDGVTLDALVEAGVIGVVDPIA